MKKMNVLHITPLLTIGGAEQKLFYILTRLNRDRFSHHVIYSIPGEFEEKIRIERIPLTRVRPMSLVNPLSLISIARIYRYIKRYKIDVVHCHLDVAYILGSLAARAADVPVIFSFQNIADEQVLGYYRIFKYLERVVSSFTHKILVESEDVMNVLCSWGIKKEKIDILANGVCIPDDLQMSRQNRDELKIKLGLQGRFLVGNLARLVDFKNHSLLLKAAAKVIQRMPNVSFVILGDGPLRAELQEQADKLGIAKNVMFLGTVLDFEPYLMSFDLFVLSSLTESTPMALLHALAYGCPAISTAVGDIPSLIHDGVDGVLVPSNDTDALGTAIIDLICDNEKRNRIARRGRETARRKFSIEAMIDNLAKVYQTTPERGK